MIDMKAIERAARRQSRKETALHVLSVVGGAALIGLAVWPLIFSALR